MIADNAPGRRTRRAIENLRLQPATMEAFSTQGNGAMTIVKENSPTSFEVEQNLKIWPSNGAHESLRQLRRREDGAIRLHRSVL